MAAAVVKYFTQFPNLTQIYPGFFQPYVLVFIFVFTFSDRMHLMSPQ